MKVSLIFCLVTNVSLSEKAHFCTHRVDLKIMVSACIICELFFIIKN